MSETKGQGPSVSRPGRRRSDEQSSAGDRGVSRVTRGRALPGENGGVDSHERPERHLRLLAVEDNPEMQKLFYHFLSPRWDVYSAYDMKTAMQLAGKIDFDVILMDINLGEATTGVDVLHALRELPKYRSTPIVAVTAYALPGDRERFLAAGFDAYIGKPFAKQQLVRMLEQIGVE